MSPHDAPYKLPIKYPLNKYWLGIGMLEKILHHVTTNDEIEANKNRKTSFLV